MAKSFEQSIAIVGNKLDAAYIQAAQECVAATVEVVKQGKAKPLDFVGALARSPGLLETSPNLAKLVRVAQSLGKASHDFTGEVVDT